MKILEFQWCPTGIIVSDCFMTQAGDFKDLTMLRIKWAHCTVVGICGSWTFLCVLKSLAVSPQLLAGCDLPLQPISITVESFQLAANQYHKPLKCALVFGVMPLAFYCKEKRWAKLDENLSTCQIQAIVYKTTQVKVDFTVTFQSHRKSLGIGNWIQILPVNIILYFFSFLLATHACQSIFLK